MGASKTLPSVRPRKCGIVRKYPPITFDWTADAANEWTIPIGADMGNAFNVGSYAMSFQLGGYDLANARRCAPVGNPHTQVTALFPTEK
jgi:hypothetical protein